MITSKILCKLTSVDTYYQSNQNPFDIMKIQNGPLMINLDDMRKVLRKILSDRYVISPKIT